MKLSLVGKMFFAVTGLWIVAMLCGINVFSGEAVKQCARDIGRHLGLVAVLGTIMYLCYHAHPLYTFLASPLFMVAYIVGIIIVT